MKDIKGLREKREREREKKRRRHKEVWKMVDPEEVESLDEGESGVLCTNCGSINNFSDYCKECVNRLNPQFEYSKEQLSELI
jgi:hypothetical protein